MEKQRTHCHWIVSILQLRPCSLHRSLTRGSRFIPLHAKTGPIPLIKSAFTWHNETGRSDHRSGHHKVSANIGSQYPLTLYSHDPDLASHPCRSGAQPARDRGRAADVQLVIWSSPLPDPHHLDTYILALYLLAAVSCLSSSAGWHVLAGCASKKWFEWGACVDCESAIEFSSYDSHRAARTDSLRHRHCLFVPTADLLRHQMLTPQGSSPLRSGQSRTTASTVNRNLSFCSALPMPSVVRWALTCLSRNGSMSANTKCVFTLFQRITLTCQCMC